MKDTEFKLIEQEFIELNKLMKLLNLVDTGGEAKIRIEQGEVIVNNAVEYQKRKKLRPGDCVMFFDYTILIK